MKIRWIVYTVTSEKDASGNCYHYSRIQSTLTGKSLAFHSDGPDNARSMMHRMVGCDYDAIASFQSVVPKRQYKGASAKLELYEHNVTMQMLADLETDFNTLQANAIKITT